MARPERETGQQGRDRDERPDRPKPHPPKPHPPKPPKPPKPPSATGEIAYFAWTIDGTEPTSQEDLFAVNTATGTVRRLSDDSSGTPFVSDRDPSWSPDRATLISARSDGTVGRLVQRSAAGAVVADLPVAGTEPVWLDAGRVLASVQSLGPAGLFDRADIVAVTVPGAVGTPVTAVAPGEWLRSPAWHPTAGLVVVRSVVDPGTGEETGSALAHVTASAVTAVLAGGAPLTAAAFTDLLPPTGWDAGPDWSPDGTTLAFTTLRPCATVEDGRVLQQMEVALVHPGGAPGVTLVTDDSAGAYADGLNDASPAFSSDGTRLAWARGHEDDWTQIVVQTIGDPSSRTVVTPDQHWFRGGLDW